MRDFVGKVAVVTGGASGIGLGLATRFAEEGMKVVLADVEEPVLEAAVTKLRQQEHDVLGVVTDVSKADSVEALARKTLDAYGKVNIVCNNAGVGGGFGVGIWEATLKDWQWTVGVNLWGVVNGVRTFTPLLLENGEEGHIVNTASSAGLTQGARIYGVTKHAVVALSESLYDGLRQVSDKVHCSVLCPGVINTRIMYGARNRPDDLQNEGMPTTQRELESRDRIARLAQETGMAPSQLADIVVEAIKAEQFYILTHDDFDEAIRTRMEDILQRRNPTPRTDFAGLRAIQRDEGTNR
ncbi:MAG TPA: SDR family NAD(P)-dependent oxidoreductase [Dehalococcoidia bacterium]|nr:SDR family NAD(P)-dependent oxidoreductase [Dehalococcoidia bacterium]